MIPYDDLVAALATWRARQGLPVVRTGAPTPVAQPPRPAAAPTPAPAARTAPVSAAVTAPVATGRVQPRQVSDAGLDDFDDGALIEEAPYDSGEDYVLSLGDAGVEVSNEATAVGAPDDGDGPRTARRGKRGQEW